MSVGAHRFLCVDLVICLENSSMKRTILLTFVLTASGALGECGDGSPSKGREAIRAACQTEIEKLCVGEDRIGQCLRRHPDELSAGCKAVLGSKKNE